MVYFVDQVHEESTLMPSGNNELAPESLAAERKTVET